MIYAFRIALRLVPRKTNRFRTAASPGNREREALLFSLARSSYTPAKPPRTKIALAGQFNAGFALFVSDSAEVRYCPVPDKCTVCGLLLASSLSTIFAVLVPTSLGINVT